MLARLTLLPPYHDHTRDVLSAYTGTTIIAYFASRGAAGLVDPTGILAKLIEAGLLGLLWLEPGRESVAQDDMGDSREPAVQHVAVSSTVEA